MGQGKMPDRPGRHSRLPAGRGHPGHHRPVEQ